MTAKNTRIRRLAADAATLAEILEDALTDEQREITYEIPHLRALLMNCRELGWELEEE